jgi:Ca-activated chloride channel family protein
MRSTSMKKHYISRLVIILLFCFATNVLATGVLYVRPRWSDQQYDKMWIKSVDIDVTIRDQVAETHVDQIFYNEMDVSVEAIYIFPLPPNAMISELVYWFNGKRFVADIRERQEAIRAYNEKLRQWLDPAMLEYLGDNQFRLSIVPIEARTEVRTEITYVELIPYDFGVSRYQYFLNMCDLSPKPLQQVQLDLDARSQNMYKTFYSPTHANSPATRLTRVAGDHYTLAFGDENFFPDEDLVIEYETVRDGVEFSLMTYTPTAADSFGHDSFYALWITPPDNISAEERMPLDMVFTADVSSSMDGERIAQLRESLTYFLEQLREKDYFNIVTFGTHVVSFRADLVAASDSNLQAARAFVSDIYALGMTNISAALNAALRHMYRPEASNNIIFLTDGYPTVGITQTDSIIAHTKQDNTNEVRLFTFGIGENISRSMLTALAIENHGYATFIASDDSIALLVENQFKRISKPVLKDLDIDFGGLDIRDGYPKRHGDLFWGTQVNEHGLYTGTGVYPVTLSGRYMNEVKQFAKDFTFSDSHGDGFRFVARLWARAKIDHLLELIMLYGENEELVNQIIELSLRFQILTKYTAFYSDPEESPDDWWSPSAVEGPKTAPEHFALYQNYPNPFNPETQIGYTLPSGDSSYLVLIRIYDTLGRLVKILENGYQAPGNYTVTWDGRNDLGMVMPSGVYFYTIQAGPFQATKKMLMIK